MHLIATFLRFSRPHTVVATSIQAITLFLITGGIQHLSPSTLAMVAVTMASCLAVNIYIVGLNQITDVEIDRINKPALPLASGALSPRDGRIITALAGAFSLALALASGPILLATVAIIFLIGTVYSLPPIRLKRFPIWAALSIAIARGLIANVGVALHYNSIMGGPVPLPTLTVLGLFFFGFAIVIALYKDLPDMVGDRMFAIQTFTTLFGPRRVLTIGQLVLTVCYVLPILIGISGLPQPQAIFLLASHLLIIGLFWWVSSGVNLDSKLAIRRFYMFLWAMFYAEFLLLSIYETAWRIV